MYGNYHLCAIFKIRKGNKESAWIPRVVVVGKMHIFKVVTIKRAREIATMITITHGNCDMFNIVPSPPLPPPIINSPLRDNWMSHYMETNFTPWLLKESARNVNQNSWNLLRSTNVLPNLDMFITCNVFVNSTIVLRLQCMLEKLVLSN